MSFTSRSHVLTLSLCLLVQLTIGCKSTGQRVDDASAPELAAPVYDGVSFITTWRGEEVSIIAGMMGDEYNYSVDWDNDGEFDEEGLTESTFHRFTSEGPHTIRIRGDFPHFNANPLYSSDMKQKAELLEISK